MSINTGIDIANLTPNTTYAFSVYPINKNGQEAGATSISFTTLPRITSAALTSVDSSNQITVGWSGSYYTVDVYYSTDDITYNRYSSYSSAQTSASLVPLSSNQQYYFRLDPSNTALVGGTSVYVKDTAAVTKGYISSFTTSNIAKTSLTLNWSGVYSTAIIYYGAYSVNITSSTTTSTQITSLTSDTTYTFTIYPYNSVSVAGTSFSVSATTASDKYSLTDMSNSSAISYYYPLDGNKYNYNVNGTSTGVEFSLGGSSSTSTSIMFKTTPGSTLSTKRANSYYLVYNAYARLTSTLTITSAPGFSISFWCYMDTSQTAGNYATINFRNTDNDYTLYLLSGGTSIKLVGSSQYGVSYTFSKTSWYHIVFTIENKSSDTNNTMNIYVNNSKQTGTGITGFPLKFSSTNAYTIDLNANGSGSDGINGYFSNIIVAKYVLSSSEISYLYSNYK